MVARVGNISFDCDDVLKVANFWSAVLGRELDPGASAMWATIGNTDPARAEPAWYFNKVPESKTAKNRVHLDMVDPDPGAVDKLVQLGATVLDEQDVPGAAHHWTVLADPEGNEFCVAVKSFTGWD